MRECGYLADLYEEILEGVDEDAIVDCGLRGPSMLRQGFAGGLQGRCRARARLSFAVVPRASARSGGGGCAIALGSSGELGMLGFFDGGSSSASEWTRRERGLARSDFGAVVPQHGVGLASSCLTVHEDRAIDAGKAAFDHVADYVTIDLAVVALRSEAAI